MVTVASLSGTEKLFEGSSFYIVLMVSFVVIAWLALPKMPKNLWIPSNTGYMELDLAGPVFGSCRCDAPWGQTP